MNDLLKNKLKSYSFWVSLASAILLLIQTIGRPLGLVIDESTYTSIVNSVLGIFVVLGIISHPAQNLLKGDATNFVDITKEVECGDNATNTQSEGYTAKNSDLPAQNDNLPAKNSGLIVDSKSPSDGGEIDSADNANSNLDAVSAERIKQAKLDFIDACK